MVGCVSVHGVVWKLTKRRWLNLLIEVTATFCYKNLIACTCITFPNSAGAKVDCSILITLGYFCPRGMSMCWICVIMINMLFCSWWDQPFTESIFKVVTVNWWPMLQIMLSPFTVTTLSSSSECQENRGRNHSKRIFSPSTEAVVSCDFCIFFLTAYNAIPL